MSHAEITVLGYALLGLIQQRPASGYDLRKIFTETPMGGYSDSPGAIYPALRRLEAMQLVTSRIEAGTGMRRRKVLHLTPTGLDALKEWLTRPIRQHEIANHLPELMLRFSFLDSAAGTAATLQFLRSYEAELKNYLPVLKNIYTEMAAKMPLSGRLALENGILGYEAQLQWAANAIKQYASKEKLP
jgi:DNA-binding PadR family transcriptional regulator